MSMCVGTREVQRQRQVRGSVRAVRCGARGAGSACVRCAVVAGAQVAVWCACRCSGAVCGSRVVAGRCGGGGVRAWCGVCVWQAVAVRW